MNKSIISNMVEEMSMTVGCNVKILRERTGLTQLDLALMLNTQRESISRIEHGESNLKLSTIIKLAQLLEVDVSILLSKAMEKADKKDVYILE